MSEILRKNYCTILGINTDAGISEIKKAYRIKAKEFHPDVNPAPNANLQFIVINEAYTYLIQNDFLKDRISKDKYEGLSREEWLNRERMKARERAARHAKMKFEAFKKTKIYKTSRFIANLVDYIYLLIGLSILVIPIIVVSMKGLDPEYPEKTISGLIGAIFIGLVFFSVILITKFEISGGKIRIKKDWNLD